MILRTRNAKAFLCMLFPVIKKEAFNQMAFMIITLLLLGVAGLWLGTELGVRGALDLAKHFKVSRVFIGLTILSIGTNLPELIVSITSGVQRLQGVETSGIIIGNIIGSCFGQLILTLGVVGLISYFTLTKREIQREGTMLIGSIILLFLLSYDGKLTRIEGLSFIVIYIFYFITIQREEKKTGEKKRAPSLHLGWTITSLIAGLAIIIYSSNLVVNNGIKLAEMLAIKQSLIGILIIGVGTSLPELVLALGAALKGSPGLTLGNLIGSNIFDILIVTGVGATISGLNISRDLLFFDIPFLLLASAAVLFFFTRKKGLQKGEAAVILTIYVFYAIAKIAGH